MNSKLKLISAISFFLILLFLPILFGLRYDYLGKSVNITYRNMFHYFIKGEPPPYFLNETPKPLIAFLFYILPSFAGYFLISLLIAFSFYYFLKISEIFTNSYLTGILAFFYSFLTFEDSWQNLLSVYWVWVYIPLMIMAIYYFLKKNYLKYGILNFLAGLIRPDSWFLAFLFLLVSLRKKTKRKPLLLLPFLAPLFWLFFDQRAFANPFYSYIVTARYPLITGILLVKPEKYFSTIFRDITDQTGWLFLFLSILSLLITIFKNKKNFEKYLILLIVILAPFIFYFLLSFRGGVLPMRRFYLLSLVFLSFFLFQIFEQFLKSKIFLTGTKLLLFFLLFLSNFSIDKLNEIKQNLKDEEEKMAAISSSLPILKRYLNEIKPQYLIVPFRRKSIFEYYLPEVKKNLESFREIIALNKDLKDFKNSLLVYLIGDFAGVENYFDFLSYFRSHLLKKENLVFEPLFSSSWIRIYLLKEAGNANY